MKKPRRPRKPKRPTAKSGKSAAPRTETRRAKKSGKRTAARRPVVTVLDDDVFIPRAARPAAATPQLDTDDDDDDGAVFVARPGAPVPVQSDWVDDANATYADMLAGSNDGDVLTELPDAISLDELGFTVDRRALNGARCKYGCGGAMSKIPTIAAHHYTCQYWQREGRTRTPFDSNLGNLNKRG